MNALEALTGVTAVQLATILREVTPAFATVGTQAMVFFVQVPPILIVNHVLFLVM